MGHLPPVAHAVNQESRRLTLCEYTHIPSHLPGPGVDGKDEYIIFSPSRDTLRLSWLRYSDWAHYPQREYSENDKSLFCGIQRLELCHSLYEIWFSVDNHKFFDLFKLFVKLEGVRIGRKTALEASDPFLFENTESYDSPEHENFSDKVDETFESLVAKDPSIKTPVITSWDTQSKYEPAEWLADEWCRRERRPWIRRPFDWYDLVPVAEEGENLFDAEDLDGDASEFRESSREISGLEVASVGEEDQDEQDNQVREKANEVHMGAKELETGHEEDAW